MITEVTIEEFINTKRSATESLWVWKQRAAKKLRKITKKDGWMYLMELSLHYKQKELSDILKRVIRVQHQDIFLTIVKLKLAGGSVNTLLKREEIEALISCLTPDVILSYDWLTSIDCFSAWQTAMINRQYLRELQAQQQQEQKHSVIDISIEIPDILKGGVTGG